MFNKYNLILLLFALTLLYPFSTAIGQNDIIAPEVAMTSPLNGSTDVDPSTTKIVVTFNELMRDMNWSWSYENRDTFPEMTGDPYYETPTSNVLPVKLKPKTTYVIWLNTVKFTNFKDMAGNPLKPYRWTFTTR